MNNGFYWSLYTCLFGKQVIFGVWQVELDWAMHIITGHEILILRIAWTVPVLCAIGLGATASVHLHLLWLFVFVLWAIHLRYIESRTDDVGSNTLTLTYKEMKPRNRPIPFSFVIALHIHNSLPLISLHLPLAVTTLPDTSSSEQKFV